MTVFTYPDPFSGYIDAKFIAPKVNKNGDFGLMEEIGSGDGNRTRY